MKYLSDLDATSKNRKLASLTNLVKLYKNWVDDLKNTSRLLDERYRSAATANIEECVRAYKRMYDGIETLKTNENAYSAFLLANRAMFMQRIHLKMQSDMSDIDRYPGDEKISEKLYDLDYYKEDDT